MEIERVNPDGLFQLDAFSQVVTASGASKVAYIAGQGAFDAIREGKEARTVLLPNG